MFYVITFSAGDEAQLTIYGPSELPPTPVRRASVGHGNVY